MQNISMGLIFKYHYSGTSIAEEFQQAREGVNYVDVANSL